ncbi:MAG: thioesterase family protein [Betaproteobacteria bacterium]|jgi:fluoroacetyl-CoA thioesterase|nr:thioesterase family protein [Betaproteobacteria bacterium]
MKSTLRAGISHRMTYTVPPDKTVPHLYPESESFRSMPEVLATGFMVGLMEWACIEAIKPHIDWPREQSLGTVVEFPHLAATPPGLTITVDVRLDAVVGRRLYFSVRAHDGIDTITEGRHERVVIVRARFDSKVEAKSAQTRGGL